MFPGKNTCGIKVQAKLAGFVCLLVFPHDTICTWKYNPRDKLWLFGLGYLADICSKMNTVSLENNRQHLLPMIKLDLSRKNWEENGNIYHLELDSILILNFWWDWWWFQQMWFLVSSNEICQYLGMYMTQCTSISQMTKHVTKLSMIRRSIQNAGQTNELQCTRIRKIYWYCFRFHTANNL